VDQKAAFRTAPKLVTFWVASAWVFLGHLTRSQHKAGAFFLLLVVAVLGLLLASILCSGLPFFNFFFVFFLFFFVFFVFLALFIDLLTDQVAPLSR
jgi:hypothetical protein